MTRLPKAGFTKTRLIPALGAEGAALFHDRLARHAIGRASAYCLESGSNLTIRIADGTPLEAKQWLGDESLDCREQSRGNLGERMSKAMQEAFAEDAEGILIVGTDCPLIDATTYRNATAILSKHDLVLGPALDGGYYLIGLQKPVASLFENISWGSSEVLVQTLAIAKREGLKVELLDPLPDVDLPEDLQAAEEALNNSPSPC